MSSNMISKHEYFISNVMTRTALLHTDTLANGRTRRKTSSLCIEDKRISRYSKLICYNTYINIHATDTA